MSDHIQFEGESTTSRFQSRTVFGQLQTPKMVSLLINKGIVKNEKTAGNMLLVLTIFFFCLAIYIFYVFGFREPVPVPFTSEDSRQLGIKK